MTSVLPKPDVETSIWIACPSEDTWEYWCDVSKETQWRGVIAAEWISDPPHGVGSTGLHVVEGIGDWPWKISEWEELRSMSWDVTGGRFEGAHTGYRVAPEDAGSRVTIHMRVKPSTIMRILLPLPGARVGACTERSVGISVGLPTSVSEGADAWESFDWMNSWQKS